MKITVQNFTPQVWLAFLRQRKTGVGQKALQSTRRQNKSSGRHGMLTMRDLASRLSETEFGTDNNTQVARAGGHQVSGGVDRTRYSENK